MPWLYNGRRHHKRRFCYTLIVNWTFCTIATRPPMTTLGAEYAPKTVEGRVLTWLLAVYAFTVFGYITATIASHFIGQDRLEDERNGIAPADVATLRSEIAALRAELAEFSLPKHLRSPQDVAGI